MVLYRLGVKKMPTPTIAPITTAVASSIESSRRSGSSAGSGAAATPADYYDSYAA